MLCHFKALRQIDIFCRGIKTHLLFCENYSKNNFYHVLTVSILSCLTDIAAAGNCLEFPLVKIVAMRFSWRFIKQFPMNSVKKNQIPKCPYCFISCR